MTVRLCVCGLVHDTLIACSRARRLHESGFLPQPNEPKTVATTAPAPKIKTSLSGPRGSKKAVTVTKPVNTAVNTVNTDRHKPGYMAEYMRKRRAKADKR